MRFHLCCVRTLLRYGVTLPSPSFGRLRSQVVKRYLCGRSITLCSPLETFFSVPEILYLCKAACPIGEVTVINHIKQLSRPLHNSSGQLERIVTLQQKNRSSEDVGSVSKRSRNKYKFMNVSIHRWEAGNTVFMYRT